MYSVSTFPSAQNLENSCPTSVLGVIGKAANTDWPEQANVEQSDESSDQTVPNHVVLNALHTVDDHIPHDHKLDQKEKGFLILLYDLVLLVIPAHIFVTDAQSHVVELDADGFLDGSLVTRFHNN